MQATVYPLSASSAVSASAAAAPKEPVAVRGKLASLPTVVEHVGPGVIRVGGERLQFSKESRSLAQSTTGPGSNSDTAGRASFASDDEDPVTGTVKKLTPDEQREVDELKARDAEVRAHEQAHKAVGGTLAGSIDISYRTGPDGKPYAAGGSVPIDLSAVPGDLEATIRKMQQVQSAALAPASPSGADQRIAAKAAATAAQARLSLVKERFAAMKSESDPANGSSLLQMTA